MPFELISDYNDVKRRDAPVIAGVGDAAGHNPLNPNDGRAYVIGEWLEFDNNKNFRRGGDNNAAAPDEAARMSWPFFLEQGRYDMQGIAGPVGGIGGKATVLYLHGYEFWTDVCNYAVIAAAGVGTALTVSDVAIAGIVRRGLDVITAAGLIHARVTFVDAVNLQIHAVRVYS